MVDHNDDFGSSAPPEGGLGNPMYGESNPGSAMGEPGAQFDESPEGHEALFEHPHPAPPVPGDAPRHPVFPLLVGAVMVLTLVIAWIVNSQPKESPATPATADAAVAPAADKPADPAAPAPPESKVVLTDIEGLKADLKALQDRIEALPKPAPAPDLGPLNSKLSDLSKQTEALAALPRKVDDLDHRLGSFDKTLVALRGDLDTLKSELKKPVEPAPATSEPAKPDDTKVADAAVDQAAGLFKASKYKEASAAFQKLTETSPNDARVWYYAALSRGSAMTQWTGETLKLFDKGVEREKAGTPDSGKIDAAFSDLNPVFKPWVDAYRKMAKPR